MGKVNWYSILAVAFVMFSCAAMILATMTQAVALAVLAVVWAILAHLR